MCEWMQIKMSAFSWKYWMLQFQKMTVESNRVNNIAYSISFSYFPVSLNCSMFYLKHTSIHNNFTLHPLSQIWAHHFPIWPGFDVLLHLVLYTVCIRKAPQLGGGVREAALRGYQHNTSLNMLEHIPSNPEYTVIRADCASHPFDCTNTRHWSAELFYGVWDGNQKKMKNQKDECISWKEEEKKDVDQ